MQPDLRKEYFWWIPHEDGGRTILAIKPVAAAVKMAIVGRELPSRMRPAMTQVEVMPHE
jgi:hypothetical protein